MTNSGVSDHMHHRAKVGIEERVPGRPDRIIERAGTNVDEALSSFREQDGSRAVFKTRAVFKARSVKDELVPCKTTAEKGATTRRGRMS